MKTLLISVVLAFSVSACAHFEMPKIKAKAYYTDAYGNTVGLGYDGKTLSPELNLKGGTWTRGGASATIQPIKVNFCAPLPCFFR